VCWSDAYRPQDGCNVFPFNNLLHHLSVGHACCCCSCCRQGFRAAKEIEDEKTALRIVRGDFTEYSIDRSGADDRKQEVIDRLIQNKQRVGLFVPDDTAADVMQAMGTRRE